MLAAGYSAAELKKGIDLAVDEVRENLSKMSSVIVSDEEIKQVASISANGEESIGELITDSLKSVGRDGIVFVEEAKGFKSTLNVVEGMQIDRGYMSPYFVTNQDKMTVEFESPYVFLCNSTLESLRDIMPLLEKVASSKKPLLIVADEVEGEAMQGLVVNKTRGALKVCAIKSPGFGESRVSMLDDLSRVLGGKVFSKSSGDNIEDFDLSDLGTCKNLSVSKMFTAFIGGNGDADEISERVESLRESLGGYTLDENEEKLTKLRLSRLSGGVAILRVGGATEAELRERKDRVDDALSATQAAIEEGIVPGGGVALVKASSSLSTKKHSDGVSAGIEVVKRACQYPLKQIVENSGGSPELVFQKVSKSSKESFGYNAFSDQFGDMLEMGIIDPSKVVRSALENAASAASMMLTVGCTMIEDD